MRKPLLCLRKTWGYLRVRSVFRRKTDLTPDTFRYLTDVSTKVDTYQQPSEPVEGGAVSDCGVSAAWMRLPSLHGRTCGVPAIRHRPAIPRNAALALALAVAVALSRCRAASPAETLPNHDCSHLSPRPALAKVEELT